MVGLANIGESEDLREGPLLHLERTSAVVCSCSHLAGSTWLDPFFVFSFAPATYTLFQVATAIVAFGV